jgi:hypothetical protein
MQALFFEGGADAADDFILLGVAEAGGGDDVGVVGAPVADADFGVLFDDSFKADGGAGFVLEERVAFVGGGPLGASDEEFAARFRGVGAAAGVGEELDESLLLVGFESRHNGRRDTMISRLIESPE